jgi:hypothetical protein
MRGKRFEDGGGVQAVAMPRTAPPRPTTALGGGSLRRNGVNTRAIDITIMHNHRREKNGAKNHLGHPDNLHSTHAIQGVPRFGLHPTTALHASHALIQAFTQHTQANQPPALPKTSRLSAAASPVYNVSHVRKRDGRFCDICRHDNEALVAGQGLRAVSHAPLHVAVATSGLTWNTAIC